MWSAEERAIEHEFIVLNAQEHAVVGAAVRQLTGDTKHPLGRAHGGAGRDWMGQFAQQAPPRRVGCEPINRVHTNFLPARPGWRREITTAGNDHKLSGNSDELASEPLGKIRQISPIAGPRRRERRRRREPS